MSPIYESNGHDIHVRLLSSPCRHAACSTRSPGTPGTIGTKWVPVCAWRMNNGGGRLINRFLIPIQDLLNRLTRNTVLRSTAAIHEESYFSTKAPSPLETCKRFPRLQSICELHNFYSEPTLSFNHVSNSSGECGIRGLRKGDPHSRWPSLERRPLLAFVGIHVWMGSFGQRTGQSSRSEAQGNGAAPPRLKRSTCRPRPHPGQSKASDLSRMPTSGRVNLISRHQCLFSLLYPESHLASSFCANATELVASALSAFRLSRRVTLRN